MFAMLFLDVIILEYYLFLFEWSLSLYDFISSSNKTMN